MTGGGRGPDHLGQLRADGELLVRALRTADLDAPVPGLDWDLRTVAIHTGCVHRWAADLVRRRLPTNETGGSAAFRPPALADDEVPTWLSDGLDALLATLLAAPADLACYTFVPGLAPRDFWCRRQAHETAIHRADVEAAQGGPAAVTSFPVDFAQDGLAEVVAAFAVEPAFAVRSTGRLLLAATDGPAWRIDFGGTTNAVRTGSADDLGAADAVVRAVSSDLYRWAWNRPVVVEIEGDEGVADLWRTVRVQ